MSNAKEIVMAYQKALGKGDFAGARKYMHDDLSFVGPFESFNRPEPYLEALGKLHHIVARVEPKKTFAEEDVRRRRRRLSLVRHGDEHSRGDGVHLRVVPHPRRQDRLGPRRLRRPTVRANVQPVSRDAGEAGPEMTEKSKYFTTDFFAFFSDLAKNNNKEWFTKSKDATRTPCRNRACGSFATPDRGCRRLARFLSRKPNHSAVLYPASTGTSASRRTRARTRPRSGSISGTRRRPGRRRWRPVTISTCTRARRWPIRASGIPTRRY